MNGDNVALSDLTDPRELTDDDLDQLRRDVTAEQERRDNLARIPEDIAVMAAKFREGGGEESALTDAISTD